jgi:hypothetical protein
MGRAVDTFLSVSKMASASKGPIQIGNARRLSSSASTIMRFSLLTLITMSAMVTEIMIGSLSVAGFVSGVGSQNAARSPFSCCRAW